MIKIKYRYWKSKNKKYKMMSFKNENDFINWVDIYGQYYNLKRCKCQKK